MKLYEFLIEAKKLIDKPEKWAQGGYAFVNKRRTCTSDMDANRFCAVGALRRLSYKQGDDSGSCLENKAWILVDDVSFERCGTSIISLNDTGTHEQVMAVYDEAIERAMKLESDKATVRGVEAAQGKLDV